MSGNPLVEDTPKPPATLVKDRTWMVPPEQRPRGWEAMGIREPGSNVAEPATAESEKKASKWGEIISVLTATEIGERRHFRVPPGEDRPRFMNNLRSALAQHKVACHFRWSIKPGASMWEISATKTGKFESASEVLGLKYGLREVDQPEPRAAEEVATAKVTEGTEQSSEVANHISEEKAKTLQESLSGGASLREAAAAAGVAKHTAQKFKQENGITATCACGKPSGHRGWCSARYQKSEKRQAVVARFKHPPAPENPAIIVEADASSFIPRDPPCIDQFVNESLKFWTSAVDDLEADRLTDFLPEMGERISVHRFAKQEADFALLQWAKANNLDKGAEVNNEVLKDLWRTVHELLVDVITNERNKDNEQPITT